LALLYKKVLKKLLIFILEKIQVLELVDSAKSECWNW